MRTLKSSTILHRHVSTPRYARYARYWCGRTIGIPYHAILYYSRSRLHCCSCEAILAQALPHKPGTIPCSANTILILTTQHAIPTCRRGHTSKALICSYTPSNGTKTTPARESRGTSSPGLWAPTWVYGAASAHGDAPHCRGFWIPPLADHLRPTNSYFGWSSGCQAPFV